jgi:hypothetical protein
MDRAELIAANMHISLLGNDFWDGHAPRAPRLSQKWRVLSFGREKRINQLVRSSGVMTHFAG